MLGEVSRRRTAAGFSPGEASTFVLSLKPSLLDHLRRELSRDLDTLGAETSEAMLLLDTLALHAFEACTIRTATRDEVAVAA